MNKKVNSKREVRNQISFYLKNSTLDEGKEDEFGYKFVKTLIFHLFNLDKSKAPTSFLKAYGILLKKENMPLLNIENSIKLFDRYKFNKGIFSAITYLLDNTQTFSFSEKFFGNFIPFVQKNNEKKGEVKFQLDLLIYLLKNNVLTESDLLNNAIYFNTIFKFLIGDNLITPENNLLVYYIEKLRLENVEAFKICQVVTKNSRLIKEVRKKDALCHFDEMYSLFGVDFYTNLTELEVEKVLKLKRLCPLIFKEFDFSELKVVTFKSLFDFIFSRIIVSKIILKSFLSNSLTENEEKWFECILNKRNLVNAENLPVKLTKKGAHYFRNLGDVGCTVTRGVIACAMMAELGGEESFCLAVVERINDLGTAPFWVESMCLLKRKGLDSRNIIEVMDYLNQKIHVENEKLDLQKISLVNLMRKVNEWHHFQTVKSKFSQKPFPSARIRSFIKIIEREKFEIIQITEPYELYLEGKMLRHCVYTYRSSCRNNGTYIFSLRKYVDEDVKRLLTIEMSNQKIRQIKGFGNRYPNLSEMKLIRIWAEKNNLELQGNFMPHL